MVTLNFSSVEAYRRWLAFGHIRGKFAKVKGHQKILIRGKPIKVKHNSPRTTSSKQSSRIPKFSVDNIYTSSNHVKIKMPRI